MGATLAAPEPADKTSDEWRYWKLRHLEAALESTDQKEMLAAMSYFRELLTFAEQEASIFTLSTVRRLLPDLIILWQQVESFDKPERTPRRKSKGAR